MGDGGLLSSANVTYIISNFCIQYRLTEQKPTIVMVAYMNDGLYTPLLIYKRAEACLRQLGSSVIGNRRFNANTHNRTPSSQAISYS